MRLTGSVLTQNSLTGSIGQASAVVVVGVQGPPGALNIDLAAVARCLAQAGAEIQTLNVSDQVTQETLNRAAVQTEQKVQALSEAIAIIAAPTSP